MAASSIIVMPLGQGTQVGRLISCVDKLCLRNYEGSCYFSGSEVCEVRKEQQKTDSMNRPASGEMKSEITELL